MAADANWHKAAPRAEIKAGEVVGVDLGGVAVGLTELDGKVHAFADVCPHAYALMSQGVVDGDVVECPLHAARFEIRTGRYLDGPDCEDIAVYETRIDGDAVWVRLP